MPTEAELQEKYSRMETGDLLWIIANKADYTELAGSLALKELQRRKVSLEPIRNFKLPANPYDSLWKRNCLFDLNFFQKLASYFLGMFTVIRPFDLLPWVRNFGLKGFILKECQFNYYEIMGFSFCVLAIISSHNFGVSFWLCWASAFLIAYAFDIGYNKQRQLDKLQKILEEGKLPYGY